MKKLLIIFIAILSNFVAKSQVREGFSVPPHPRIGLSLSGGGAKGFAHVGVLKVLDSLGVKVDYIAGTSMGSIVGGLYAAGYTGKDIEKIILDTDFYAIIANEKTRQENTFFNKTTDKYILTLPIKDKKINVLPKAISKGQKNIYMLKELFKNVANINDFSKLPIPFMCVATNLESGKMEIFEQGDLINSIMASSAFPGLMDPVKINDSLYIDGAMTVNYPSKPLKDKGIDVVIGVDLNQGLNTRKDLNSVVDILNQVIDFGIQKETKNQYRYTDINIHPDLRGLSATSYGDKEKLLNSGLVEAKKYTYIFKELPKREQSMLRAPVNPVLSNVYKIDSLSLEDNKIFNKSYVQGKLGLKLPSLQTYGSINKMIDRLYATNNYNLINYDILQHNDKNYLKLQVNEDDTRFFLKFGLHYDEVFHTGLLLNATIKRLLFRNSIISLDGIIGDKPRYYFNYFIDNGYIPGFGIYASGMTFELKDKYSDTYNKWLWLRNEIFLQSVWKDRYAIGGGLSHDYFESILNSDLPKNSKNSVNPYVFIKSDTRDDPEFPSRGFYMNTEGKILDLFNNNDVKKSLQAKTKISINLPFGSAVTYRLNLFGGFTLGENLHPYYQYRLGGIFDQNMGNFASFPGYNLGQIYADDILTASNDVQVKIYKNIYLIGNFSLANYFNKITFPEAVKIKDTSTGITAGYKSPFGQIKLNYNIVLNNGQGSFTVILGHWF